MSLYITHCYCSTLYYFAIMILLYKQIVIVVRRLWQLPYTTHCNLLPAFAFGNNFCSIIHYRFVNFSRVCLSSNKVHIKFVAFLAAESQMYVFGKNLFYMSHMNLPAVSSFASVACELYLVK